MITPDHIHFFSLHERDIDRPGKWVSASCIHILSLIHSIHKVGGGGGKGGVLIFDAESKTAQIPYSKFPISLCVYGGGGAGGGGDNKHSATSMWPFAQD